MPKPHIVIMPAEFSVDQQEAILTAIYDKCDLKGQCVIWMKGVNNRVFSKKLSFPNACRKGQCFI